MVNESRTIDVDKSLKQQEWAPDEFASILYKYTEMTKDIREMKSSKRIAMFQVDAKQFVKSVLPYPQVNIGLFAKLHSHSTRFSFPQKTLQTLADMSVSF